MAIAEYHTSEAAVDVPTSAETELPSNSTLAPTPTPTAEPTLGPLVGTGRSVAGRGTEANPLDTCEKLKLRRAFKGEIGVGRKFDKYFRSALLLQYRQAKSMTAKGVSSGRLRMYSAMLNGYLDAANSSIFIPHAMVGIEGGGNNARIKNSVVSGTSLR